MRTAEECGCNSRRLAYQVSHVNACSLYDEVNCAEAKVWKAIEWLDASCSELCPLECARSVFAAAAGINYGSQAVYEYNYVGVLGRVFWCQYNAIVRGTPVPSVERCGQLLNVVVSNFSYFSSNVVQLAVNYEALAYTWSEEEPKMSGEELFGVLGGHLHLFLGMSLLSFVEVAELLVIFAAKYVGYESDHGIAPNAHAHVLSTHTAVHKRAQTVNMDALPNAFRAHYRTLAAVWIGLLCAAIGMCAYLIVESTLEYTAWHVVTTVKRESAAQPRLPIISICNIHPFTTTYAYDFIRNVTNYNILRINQINQEYSNAQSIFQLKKKNNNIHWYFFSNLYYFGSSQLQNLNNFDRSGTIGKIKEHSRKFLRNEQNRSNLEVLNFRSSTVIILVFFNIWQDLIIPQCLKVYTTWC